MYRSSEHWSDNKTTMFMSMCDKGGRSVAFQTPALSRGLYPMALYASSNSFILLHYNSQHFSPLAMIGRVDGSCSVITTGVECPVRSRGERLEAGITECVLVRIVDLCFVTDHACVYQ